MDYQADMDPLGTTTHSLVPFTEPKPEEDRGISVKEIEGRIRVNNGVLELEIDKDVCRPLGSVRVDGEILSEGGLNFYVTSSDGSLFLAANEDAVKFEVEEHGPLRLQMRWEGSHVDETGTGHLDFLVRMTVYAGNPFIRIDHTFVNRLDPDVTEVKEVGVRLPLQVEGQYFSAADVYRPPTVFTANGPVSLEQYTLGHFKIRGKNGEVLRDVDNNSMGWVDISGPCHGLLLAGKSFWQNYPKRLSADGSSVCCHLIPNTGKVFPIPRGMAKTHTFFVCFHEGGLTQRGLSDLAFTVQRWPMPRASSEYYQKSGQLWDFFPYYPTKYPRLETGLRNLFSPDKNHLPTNPREGRAYGLKHYGDFILDRGSSPDPDGTETYYLNNEYDTPHVLAMMFLRTGEIVKWWGAETHALHMMDVDTCHHSVPTDHIPDPKLMLGAQYRHCYQHIGSIQDPEDDKFIPASGSHTFGEGLLDYYHLTGDRRTLEVATGYAKNLAYTFSGHDPIGLGRYSGWGLLVLGGAYMVRPSAEIRREAERNIDKIISQQGEGGGILEANIHDRAFEDRKIHLCMRGLIKWHQATGDGKTEKLILELMEDYLNTGLMEEGLPLYSNWPEHAKPTTAMQGFANLESLAYAYDLTGNRRFIDAGIPALCHAVEWITSPDEEVHVNFQRILRGPFRFMAIAHELGILERVPGAAGWLV
ncbi:MAG: hypothetical protein HXS50_01470 [Theionarchaea archaeon]|nr:hypothetical protein [Theionarchaea archaeon]